MQMPKPTDEDKARFAALVVELPGAETEPMFGQLGARERKHVRDCSPG